MASVKVGKEKLVRKLGFLYYLGKDGFIWASPMKTNKTGKKEKVGTEKIVREKGFLYFLSKEGFVEKTVMKRRKKGEVSAKPKKVAAKVPKKAPKAKKPAAKKPAAKPKK